MSRHEYLVLSACFSEPLRAPATLVRTCYDLSLEIIGDRRVWSSLFGLPAGGKGDPAEYKGRLSEGIGISDIDQTVKSRFASFGAETQKAILENWGPECMWRLRYEVGGVFLLKLPPYLTITFAFSLLSLDHINALNEQVPRFFEAFHATGACSYAVAAVGDERQNGCGGLFEAIGQGIVHYEHSMMRLAWLQAGGPRNNKVRGVYWGNLLSPSMVEQLGGAELLVDEYRATEIGINSNLAHAYPDGSVALYLSRRISDFKFPHMGLTLDTHERGAWLYRRFASGRLLPGT